jgi:hypothetical protein
MVGRYLPTLSRRREAFWQRGGQGSLPTVQPITQTMVNADG